METDEAKANNGYVEWPRSPTPSTDTIGERADTLQVLQNWTHEEEFNSDFKNAWIRPVSGTPLYKLQQKINSVINAGKDWARRKRVAAETTSKVAAELQIVAVRIQSNPLNSAYQDTYRELKAKLIELQHKEQLDMQQRVHVNWITKGD